MFSYIYQGNTHTDTSLAYMQQLGMDSKQIESVLAQQAYESRLASSPRITRLAFMQRFTQAERVAIRQAAKNVPEIEDYLAMVGAATFIDLERADTIESVNALATAGLITQERAIEITTAPVEAAEVYK